MISENDKTAIEAAMLLKQQQAIIERLTAENAALRELITRAKHAHMADIKLRINGKDEGYEADWLKYMKSGKPQPSQQQKPAGWFRRDELQNIGGGHLVSAYPKDYPGLNLVPLYLHPPHDDTRDSASEVQLFAEAMKDKMEKQWQRGYRGWRGDIDDDGKEGCTVEQLQKALVSHVAKGDPVDVANFCMMLWNRKAGTKINFTTHDDTALLRNEVDAIAKLNHTQWLALENVRLLAARHRKEEWAQHMLRFIEECGTNKAQVTRNQVEPVKDTALLRNEPTFTTERSKVTLKPVERMP